MRENGRREFKENLRKGNFLFGKQQSSIIKVKKEL